MAEQEKQERQVVLNGKIALAVARAERAEAELSELRARLKRESDVADRRAEQKLGMLRLIFLGISLLMFYLGLLVSVNWFIPNAVDRDGIGAAFFQTSKDIILVLTGILGSAMANVFDSGRSATRSTDAPPPSNTDNGS
jgi:hypothetical protein